MSLLQNKFSKAMALLQAHEVTIISFGEMPASHTVLPNGDNKDTGAYIYWKMQSIADGSIATHRFYVQTVPNAETGEEDIAEKDLNNLNAVLNAIIGQTTATAEQTPDIASTLTYLKDNAIPFKVVLKQNADATDKDKFYTNFYYDKNTLSSYSRRPKERAGTPPATATTQA